MTGAPQERGLQRERTALAWDRTGVAFMVVGAFFLRVAGGPYPQLRHLPAAVALVVGFGLVAGAGRGRGRRDEEAEPRARPVLVRLVSLAALGLCCASLVLVLMG